MPQFYSPGLKVSTESSIITGVVIYLAAMLVVGLWASRKISNSDNFLVAGRSMPLWLVSATLVASWLGGGSIIGAAGASYDDGLLGVIADPFGASMVFFIVGFFFVRMFRRLRLLTVVEFLDNRYGKTASTIAAVGMMSSTIGWAGGLLVAFGLIFQSLTGVPMETGILFGAVVVFIYTITGGLWAVALTDFVQFLLIAIGLVMLLIVVLVDVGGWSAVSSQLPEGTFRSIPEEPRWDAWLNYFRAWLILGFADVTSQTLMQRGLAAKSERVAQNSFYLAGAFYLTLGMIPVILGLVAMVTMPGIADTETVIPELALNHLHPVAVSIFVGALLAAIMSSADSALLSCASIFTVNIAPLFTRRTITDRQRLLISRVTIPLFGIIALVIALEVQLVYDLIQDANSVLLVSVVVPFVCGMWWRKANRTGCLAAMAVGFLTWMLALVFAPELPGDLLGLFTCGITMAVVTLLTQRSDPPQPLRNSDGEEVAMDNRLGVLSLLPGRRS